MIVNKYKGNGGGGGTGSTITIDSALSSSSTNPVENRVITNAIANFATEDYVNAAITGITEDFATEQYVDDAISAATSNLVTQEDLNGTTAVTQLEIIDSATTEIYFLYRHNTQTQTYYKYFKETNVPGYYALRLDIDDEIGQEYNYLNFQNISADNGIYFQTDITATTENLGTYISLGEYVGSRLFYLFYSLDNSYDYYVVYNYNNDTVAFTKTLPVVTYVEGSLPTFDDIPCAQDGSKTKYYVYNYKTNKKVISDTRPGFEVSNKGMLRVGIDYKKWGETDFIKGAYYLMPTGSNKVSGLKTFYDSETIFKADQALEGFEEQITLTLTGQSAVDSVNGKITGGTGNVYLYETDNERYEVFPCSAITSDASAATISRFQIGGTASENRRYFQEIGIDSKTPAVVGCKGKVGTTNYNQTLVLSGLTGTNNYIILDKELLTYEITDSLTITRTKNIAEAIAQGGGTGSTITVDTALSSSSTNPVENRVITLALNGHDEDITLTIGSQGSGNDPKIQGSYYLNNGDEIDINEYMYATNQADYFVYQVPTTAGSGTFVDKFENIVFPYNGQTLKAVWQYPASANTIYDIATSGTPWTITGAEHSWHPFSGAYVVVNVKDKWMRLGSLIVPAHVGGFATEQYVNEAIYAAASDVANNYVESTNIRHMVRCTQAEYNAMATHDPNTFYIIVNS